MAGARKGPGKGSAAAGAVRAPARTGGGRRPKPSGADAGPMTKGADRRSAAGGIAIREMRPADIAQAARIEKRILSAKRAGRLRYRIEDLLGAYLEKSPGTCLAAERGGKLVGFMVGCIKEFSFGVERAGWVEILGVDPEHMGGGVGRALGKALLRRFAREGIKEVYTSVLWDSGDLVSFFKSLGFDKSSFVNLRLALRGRR